MIFLEVLICLLAAFLFARHLVLARDTSELKSRVDALDAGLDILRRKLDEFDAAAHLCDSSGHVSLYGETVQRRFNLPPR
jgi:hypothetical protein